MLRSRVITALMIAPLALAALLLLDASAYVLFIAAVLAVCGWEWANFAHLRGWSRVAYGLLIGLITSFVPPSAWWLWISLMTWVIAGYLVLRFPKYPATLKRPTPILALGVVVMVPAGLALVMLQSQPNYAANLVLLLGLVWCADIGAYFTGRRWGKRKLHPAVSPGKSWAGVYGGWVITLVFVLLWRVQTGLFGLSNWKVELFWLLMASGMVFVSILGDLSMSMFKRVRDVKDSSQLLPGHGGFLDRLDSLFSVAPILVLCLVYGGLV
jgi:phosphatidate cytidylyltransferase